MAKRGQVKHFKVGALTRFKFADILEHEAGPPPEPAAPQPAPNTSVAPPISPRASMHQPNYVALAAAQRVKARRAAAVPTRTL
jgi:hypothetical protein